MGGKIKTPVSIFLVFVRIMFVLELIAGFFAPIFKNRVVSFNLFQMVEMALYVYALLSAHGYFKKVVSMEEDGTIQYETSVPLLPIILVRVAEILFYFVRRRSELNLSWFGALFVLDVLFLLFLLLDKGSYCYESESVEEL